MPEAVAKRRMPIFEIDWVSEISDYTLREEIPSQVGPKDIEESVIQLSTNNDMVEDKPVFSLILFSTIPWDHYIRPNDLIRIRMYPDKGEEDPDNPYIMVGLVSEITEEADYDDGSIMYRITGEGMMKVITNFTVGTIREVATIIPSVGWLQDDPEEGIAMSGKGAAEIAQQLMDDFVFKYAQYNFHNGKELDYYIDTSFESWEFESLYDTMPFINYEGSIRQFIEDLATKPFLEFYSEFRPDGDCNFIMRRTPFDFTDWYNLPKIDITSDEVKESSIGINDGELYSIFIVNPQNVLDFNSMQLGVTPKFHPSLLEKYGYKQLNVDNRYMQTQAQASANEEGGEMLDEEEEEDEEEEIEYTDYPALGAVDNYFSGYTDPDEDAREFVRKNKVAVIEDMTDNFVAVDKALATNIVDAYLSDSLTEDYYVEILEDSGATAEDIEQLNQSNYATEVLNQNTERLFNWNQQNGNFRSGELRVKGSPAYRVGMRLIVWNKLRNITYEFYIEKVDHEFSFSEGYTTILGVTRGLPNAGGQRFEGLWGRSEDFLGGYLGEMSIADQKKQKIEAREEQFGGNGGHPAYGGGANKPGSEIAMDAVAIAQEKADLSSVYEWGGGHSNNNPFNASPIRVDCSGFVWWVFEEAGIKLGSNPGSMNTQTIKKDPQLTVVSERGSNKYEAWSKLKQGDLIYFTTESNGTDGHMGIYVGQNGEDPRWIGSQSSTGIQEESLRSNFWWDAFKGHVLRLE